MKQSLALRELAEVMKWTDETAGGEFAWLRLIARLKYDGYQGYLTGVRFLASLVVWLRQFDERHRAVAYSFFRNRLVYISNVEIRHLVDQFYHRTVQPLLVEKAAAKFGIPPYSVWSHREAPAFVKSQLRRTLFMGLSDGARMDVLRRSNPGRISNEQTVLAPTLDLEKWQDLQNELRKDLKSQEDDPKFDTVYVVDDLTASGTSLIRNIDGKWKGKLPKLRNAIARARQELENEFALAERVTLCVHHYIATESALQEVEALAREAGKQFLDDWWFAEVRFSAGMRFGVDAKVVEPDPMLTLADEYYDSVLEDRHAEESGDKNMRRGYKSCALPLILEHNTPNNSLSLLWAETSGKKGGHAMRPLFKRITRHV